MQDLCAVPTVAISIHALLAESDSTIQCSQASEGGFLSTLSLRRATRGYCKAGHGPAFLSTLSLRRATLQVTIFSTEEQISIHALLAESDTTTDGPCGGERISIHALLAESDPVGDENRRILFDFYPRSPCGERRWTKTIAAKVGDFYPRSPCGERHHKKGNSYIDYCDFYPRSPCGERRLFMLYDTTALIFLSTLSLRRATALGLLGWLRVLISIHALLAESDGTASRH